MHGRFVWLVLLIFVLTLDYIHFKIQNNVKMSPTTNNQQGHNLHRPLSVVAGGGHFYSFYIEDWHFQGPDYRHLLINESSAGVNMYHLNNDCASSDAAVEVAGSR